MNTRRQARRLRRIVNRTARNAARDGDATALVARREIWMVVNQPTTWVRRQPMKWADYWIHVIPHPAKAGLFSIVETAWQAIDGEHEDVDSTEIEGRERAIELAINIARGTTDAARVAVWTPEGEQVYYASPEVTTC